MLAGEALRRAKEVIFYTRGFLVQCRVHENTERITRSPRLKTPKMLQAK